MLEQVYLPLGEFWAMLFRIGFISIIGLLCTLSFFNIFSLCKFYTVQNILIFIVWYITGFRLSKKNLPTVFIHARPP